MFRDITTGLDEHFRWAKENRVPVRHAARELWLE
jgi:hypothetical protein